MTFLARSGVALLLAACAAAGAGCNNGGLGCTLRGCGSVTLRVRDARDNPVTAFRGTWQQGSRTLPFACGGTAGSDAGTDGGADAAVSGSAVTCLPNGEASFFVSPPTTLTIIDDVTGARFSGDVETIARTDRPNGPFCGPTCYVSPIVVTLR